METKKKTLTTAFRIPAAMADRVEVCMCEKCGNEAEMTVNCQWADIRTPSAEIRREQKETRTCKVCGNEADMIIDFD